MLVHSRNICGQSTSFLFFFVKFWLESMVLTQHNYRYKQTLPLLIESWQLCVHSSASFCPTIMTLGCRSVLLRVALSILAVAWVYIKFYKVLVHQYRKNKHGHFVMGLQSVIFVYTVVGRKNYFLLHIWDMLSCTRMDIYAMKLFFQQLKIVSAKIYVNFLLGSFFLLIFFSLFYLSLFFIYFLQHFKMFWPTTFY